MTKYMLNQIYIENFKGIDYLHLKWNGGQLIVLDGPNGFGKTTIFDAIELALTGKIERIKKPEDARFAYNDVLFSNDPTKNVSIKVEFVSEGAPTITIAKLLPFNKKLTGLEKQPGKWGIFDTYLLDSIESPITNQTKCEQSDISSHFGINEIDRLYSLFYYIQQEENTAFLKRPGKERMGEISRLFDTKSEENEKKYFDGLAKILDQEKKNKQKAITEIEQRLESYKNVNEMLNNDDNVLNYEPLLNGISNMIWDKEDITISDREMRDKFINELLLIEDFISNFNEYKSAVYNQRLGKYLDNRSLISATISNAFFLEKYQEIKVLHEKEIKLSSLLTKLKNYQENILSINYDELRNYTEFDLDTVKQKIEIIKTQSTNRSLLSRIVNELNTTRDKLLQQSSTFHEHTVTQGKECPFCGYDWQDHDRLLSEFQTKKEHFISLYDESTIVQQNEIEEVFQKYLSPIISWIEDYLSHADNVINADFYAQIERGSRREKEILAFLEWCIQNGINISPYINNNMNEPIENMESATELLVTELRGKAKIIKEGYAEFDEKYNQFETVFKVTFGSQEANVDKVTLEAIERKKQYIDFLFFNQNNKRKNDDISKLEKLSEDHSKLQTKLDEIKNIIGIYNNGIKKHWKKIMIDIEIPFYIYSGKIMQNYQRGLGIFIKEKEDAGSIVFVSDNSSDHDALNYLSSGQLSALVISFTLALNKVYANKDLGVILIDDPVQSMDEINMASLTELLRNDFNHKQIIISTHEDDVSRYLQYKFSKYGLNTLNFNMRQHTQLKELKQQDHDGSQNI